MNVIALTRPALLKHSELALGMHRLRRRVFRDRLDWKVSVSDGLEIDQYDALTPTCLLGVDRRDVVGCVRLLPTTGPNMLADTFPVLLDGRAAPKNAKIWETSRFCVDTQNVAATAENGLKEATFLLFAAMIDWGQQHALRQSRPSLISAWSESCAGPDGISIASANLAKSEPPKPSPDCCRSLMMLSKRSGRRGRFWGWRLVLHQAWRSRHSVERLQLLTMAKRFSTMDPAAFAALVERCAPTTAMVRPLMAIVRQASSFEPLLITIEGRKPIPIQATDRNEAIQLVTEAIATGQPVRTGLAQLDAEDMKQAGLTATTTFDACKHIAGLGRLFEARLQAANVNASGRDQGIASVVASFVAKAAGTTPEPRTRPMASAGSTGDMPAINTPAPSVREHPNWDVYRSGLGTSAFVYER